MGTKDARFVPGAGCSELVLAGVLQKFADMQPGLDQYAINKYAAALEIVPRTLAENAGQDATDVISRMYAEHQAGNVNTGVDVENGGVTDVAKTGVLDLLETKKMAIKLATEAAMTVLRVDQIIMAKPAGGPKAPEQ